MLTIPIEAAFKAYLGMLAEPFAGTEPGIAEENLQARIRGNILMALSNKFGYLVLTTGQQERDGDGLRDPLRRHGRRLRRDQGRAEDAGLRSSPSTATPSRPVIPRAVIDKEPSAELRPDQRDADSLPPYEVLDPILQAYVEEDRSIEEIVAMGYRRGDGAPGGHAGGPQRVQAPPGAPGHQDHAPAFGRDRRLPITNRYVEGA